MLNRALLPALWIAVLATPAFANEVNVYSYREQKLIQPLFEAFTKDTGIKVNVISASSGLEQRIKTEGANSPADVLLTVDVARLQDAIDAGITQPIQSALLEKAVPKAYHGPDGAWYGISMRARVVYASKERVKQDAITYEDLADPKWKGRKIIMEARLVPFAMLGTEWGKGKAIELTKKILSQQQPLIVQGGTTVANALAGGQVSIAVGTYAFTIEGLKKQGAAVDWVAVSPLPVLTSAEGILKTAAHPNAGRFFAGWMGTAEGQKIRYASRGQAMEVGRNAIGNVAERIRSQKPAIILETDKTFASILEIQRELGKLLGALR